MRVWPDSDVVGSLAEMYELTDDCGLAVASRGALCRTPRLVGVGNKGQSISQSNNQSINQSII